MQREHPRRYRPRTLLSSPPPNCSSLLILRQDIEEDKELQSQIALYRNPNGRDGSGDEAMEVDSDEDDDEIDVALESLVDKTDVDTL